MSYLCNFDFNRQNPSNNSSLYFSWTKNSINSQHELSQYFAVVEYKSILEIFIKACVVFSNASFKFTSTSLYLPNCLLNGLTFKILLYFYLLIFFSRCNCASVKLNHKIACLN